MQTPAKPRPRTQGSPFDLQHPAPSVVRTPSPRSRFLFSPQLSASGVPGNAATFSRRRHTHARVQSLHPHTDTQKHTHTHQPAFRVRPPKGHEYSLLTSVGDCEAVGYLQIVDVGCQSELRSGKLNHPYAKCTVFLIGAPGKQPPCKEQTPSKEDSVSGRGEESSPLAGDCPGVPGSR